MIDYQSAPYAIATPEARMAFELDSIGNLNAAAIPSSTGPLIKAKRAFEAAASKADDVSGDCRQALAELVRACSGEVEEVFRGEIGDAMRRARNVLGIIHIDDAHEASGE
jgi:hypothetical protein